MNSRLLKHRFGWIVAATIIILFLLGRFSAVLVDWLWFAELGYKVVFRRLLLLRLALGAVAGLAAFVFLGFNLKVAFRRALAGGMRAESAGNVVEIFPGEKYRIPPPLLQWGAWLLAAFVAIPFGLYFGEQWDAVLRYLWGEPVGRVDPIYGRDLGFYLFDLPFLQIMQNNLTFLAFLAFAAVLGLVVLTGLVRRKGQGFAPPRRPAALHLALTCLLFMAGQGWGYVLERYELLYSVSGAVHGAGYTDLQVVRLGLWAMAAASVALGLTVLLGYRRNWLRLAVWGAGGYLVLLVALLMAAPWAVQSFIVEPNELELETPFLQHEIAFTREAYGIDRVEERAYPALSDLSREQVSANRQTLRNIRLWDWRPLLQTFRQLQEIRLYYQFYEVDIDRYRLDGEVRQVMLSARELAPELPERADTWVNRTLQFTHGYGLVMSLAAQEGEEGTPAFLVQDLPPKTSRGLELEKPAVFYGEKMPGYRIVNSGVEELDYPKGDENVYTRYSGKGGIRLDAFWKKLLFAWEFSDLSILLSDYLQEDSRLQMHRRVQERVGSMTPFLHLDSDPYLVLSEGRLFWFQDAYTVSDRYPYAESYRGRLNYIRNAVKAVVDAYDGTVALYMMQPDEPVLRVYRRAFPGIFRPLEEMPADLRRHLRYPEDLFRIQVDKYSRYHMTSPQVFYNNEDLWTLPQEKYAGDPVPMDPYYILMRLPGEERLEFLLMLPLTPRNRNNMIAWMAARCDEPDYGRLLVYKLPKDKLILGPSQVEAMIDQDPVISRQLSLWDQRGSRVIRGNLLVIPLDHSFIYVEPVYLIAEGNNIPQLRRVIVAYNERVAMEPTLEQAVAAVFGPPAAALPEPEAPVPSRAVPPAWWEEARASFERAQRALQEGNWQAFGRAMGELQELLRREKEPAP
jgi:uncharacterized membrane protein (UPF0182 family)